MKKSPLKETKIKIIKKINKINFKRRKNGISSKVLLYHQYIYISIEYFQLIFFETYSRNNNQRRSKEKKSLLT